MLITYPYICVRNHVYQLYRCVSIGEVTLSVCEKEDKYETNALKKSKKNKSYFFNCGTYDPLEAFVSTTLDKESQCELYSSLGKELIQQILYKKHFTPPLNNIDGDDKNNPINILSSLYSLASPLLEFIWLAIKYAGSSHIDENISKCNGVIKILSLDCITRDEPSIACALYAVRDNTSHNINSEKTNGKNHENKVLTDPDDMLSLIGFIDVRITKIIEPVSAPVSPRIPRERGNSNLTDENEIENSKKILLKISSLSNTFPEQLIDMEVYRECLQKKMWTVSHPNCFHILIRKLMVLYCE
jgi:hypothetical protein